MSLKLQPRERQVLDLLSTGSAMKQIADRLGVGISACSNYILRARERNGLKTGWQLLARYVREQSLAEYMKGHQ